MIPAPEVKPVCSQCGVVLNHFANVDYCPNHGQLGVGHRGDRCPNGCDPRLTVLVAGIGGAGKRCNGCGWQW
jgi:hypothetical protein